MRQPYDAMEEENWPAFFALFRLISLTESAKQARGVQA
jgi:hypothetical protein